MLLLYYAIFHQYLLYEILIWKSIYKTYLKKLGTLQNKAVKIIGGGIDIAIKQRLSIKNFEFSK